MLRYVFIFLPLALALFLWGNSIPSITDFILPSVLVFISVFGWSNCRQLTNTQRIVLIYIGISWMNEMIAYYLGLTYGMNFPSYHFYIPIQFLVFAMIYTNLLQLNRFKSIFWFIVLSLVVGCLIYSLFISSIYVFPSFQIVLLSAFLLTLCLFQFRSMILFPINVKIEGQPVFWFNLGTFVFFTLGFFLFGFLSSVENLPIWMYDILTTANIFLYATYFIAIILDSKPKPTQNDSIS